MKRLTIIIFSFLFFSIAHAQQSALGKDEKYIKDLLYKNNYIILSRRVLADKSVQVDFGYFDTSKYNEQKQAEDSEVPNNNTPTATLTCIIENEICSRYIVGYTQQDVPVILKYLNTQYKKTDTDRWVDAKGLYEANTYPINDVFAVEFKKIEGN